jgi:2-phosphosulfolactate phosphatase
LLHAPLALDVAVTPAFAAPEPRARHATTFIVVDVIRATTTLSVLFERGCRRALIAPGIVEARTYRDKSGRDVLLAGEAGGVAPPGFDFGNSPAELATAPVAGKEIVFATTNGTRALRVCTGGWAVYTGAFRNARAVCAAALGTARWKPGNRGSGDEPERQVSGSSGATEATLTEDAADIVIVCSGRSDRPAFDDTICAGYLTDELLRQDAAIELHEGARIALAAAREAMRNGGLRAALAVSDAARAIARVSLSGDLDWCVAIDATDAVPAVTGATAEGLLIVERLAEA